MQRLDLDYWYTLGRAMAMLDVSFGIKPCDIDERGWSRVNTALGWLRPLSAGEFVLIPATQRLATELVEVLTPLLEKSKGHPARVDATTQAKIYTTLTAFNNIIRSGAQELYVFHVIGTGAYSVSALLENAASHLSPSAQKAIAQSETRDFCLAGACYVCDLPTASGFHAMRALEAEARRYHMAVTGLTKEVDWTLNPLINGNSGKKQIGLRDQWKKEGARDDSPLMLIISLLTSITQIYRNPIMHPEMTLNPEQAKLVFDTAALVISAMVEDRINRQKP
jgi:hypothetical protein